jgi:hypothetical protein
LLNEIPAEIVVHKKMLSGLNNACLIGLVQDVASTILEETSNALNVIPWHLPSLAITIILQKLVIGIVHVVNSSSHRETLVEVVEILSLEIVTISLLTRIQIIMDHMEDSVANHLK